MTSIPVFCKEIDFTAAAGWPNLISSDSVFTEVAFFQAQINLHQAC